MKKYLLTASLFISLLTLFPQAEVLAIPTYEDACLAPYIASPLTAGDQNQDVRDLQTFLISRGLLAQGSDTGYFGPLTRQGVRDFQTQNGIVSSGTAATTGFGAVGPRTRATINEVVCNGVTGGTSTIPQNPNLNPGAPTFIPTSPQIPTGTNPTSNPTTSSAALPTVTLSVGQSSVPYERSTSLSWSSSNAVRCIPSGAWSWSGTMPTTGSLFSTGALIAPINSFSITCYNSAGQSATDTKTVSVTGSASTGSAPFSMSIKAAGSTNPSPITAGTPVAIDWSINPSSTFISSCTGSGSGVGATGIDASVWNGGKGSSGSMTARPLTTTTYTISCTANGQTASASVTVSVSGSTSTNTNPTTSTGPAITSFTATPGRITSVGVSQEFTLAWTSRNSAYCYGQDGTASQWLGQWGTSGTTTINIFVDGTFTLKCTTGVGGLFAPTDTKTVSINVNRSTPNGPAVSFTATPSSIAAGGSATIAWSAPTASVCRGGGDNSFGLYVSSVTGSRALTFLYPGTWNLTITCNSLNGGSTTRTVTVVVGGSSTTNQGATGTGSGTQTAPSSENPSGLGVDIEANGSDGPITVSAGQPISLRWGAVPNALIFRMVCTASGPGFNGYQLPVGSLNLTASQSGTFTISCQDNAQGYRATDSVTVTVGTANTAPSAIISAFPSTVTSGTSATLTWSATNANVCTLTGGNLNVGNNSVQGNVSTGPLTQATTYSLSCYKNVANSNGLMIPVYAPTQTVTVGVSSPTGTGTNTTSSGTTQTQTTSVVSADLRANNAKGSITTTASSAAVALSFQLLSPSSTALIGWTCSASGVPGISSIAPGNTTLFVRPTVTTSYSVSCTSFLTGETASDSVTVIVQ